MYYCISDMFLCMLNIIRQTMHEEKWKYWFINFSTLRMWLKLAAVSLQQKAFFYMKRQTDSKQIHQLSHKKRNWC